MGILDFTTGWFRRQKYSGFEIDYAPFENKSLKDLDIFLNTELNKTANLSSSLVERITSNRYTAITEFNTRIRLVYNGIKTEKGKIRERENNVINRIVFFERLYDASISLIKTEILTQKEYNLENLGRTIMLINRIIDTPVEYLKEIENNNKPRRAA